MLRTPPEHREDPLPKVRCWVNEIHGFGIARTPAWECSRHPLEPQKMKADRWERSAFSMSSAWESSRSQGVCGKGLQRTAWEPLADIGCTVDSMCDAAGKVQWRISTLTVLANCSVLIFRIEYLDSPDQASQAAMTHSGVALLRRDSLLRMLRFLHPESATTN